MKKIIGVMLIILSVGLNVAFIVTWIGHRLPTWGGGCRGGNRNGCAMHVRLGATQPQWREIEARLSAFRESSRPLCVAIQSNRLELLDLIAAPQPDGEAIRAKQTQILEGQRQMQEETIGHLTELAATLTPEQRKRLFELMRERTQYGGPAPMMMGARSGEQ
jgi:Spy/CpxP family protein refolding chaperone